MSTMTVRLPDAKYQRLKQLAKARHQSVNKLIDEWATVALAAHDAELRFRAMAKVGNPQRALNILDKLDRRRSR